MNTREIVEWFKTSIPGIVILGAFGSILALALLKISKRALPNLSSFVKNRFLFPLLYRFYKRAVIEQIIAARLMKAGERTKLLIHCCWIFAWLVISTVVLFTAVSLTILYFAVTPFYLSFGAFLLVTLSFLSLINLLGDAFSAVAVYEVTLGRDLEEQVHTLKKLNRVEFFRTLRAELPQRSEPAPPRHDADSSPSAKENL